MDEQVASLSRSLYIYQDPYLILESEAEFGSTNGWITLAEDVNQLRIVDEEVAGTAGNAQLFDMLLDRFAGVPELDTPGWEIAANFFPQLALIGVEARQRNHLGKPPQLSVFGVTDSAGLLDAFDATAWIATLLYMYAAHSKQQLMDRLPDGSLSRSELALELARRAERVKTGTTVSNDSANSAGVILQPTTVYPYWVKPEIMEAIEEDATVAHVRWSDLLDPLDEQTRSIALHAATFTTSYVADLAGGASGSSSRALAEAADWLRSPSVAFSFALMDGKSRIEDGRIINGAHLGPLVGNNSIPDPRHIARSFRVKFVVQNSETILEDLDTKSSWGNLLNLDAVHEVLRDPHLASEFGEPLYRLWKGVTV